MGEFRDKSKESSKAWALSRGYGAETPKSLKRFEEQKRIEAEKKRKERDEKLSIMFAQINQMLGQNYCAPNNNQQIQGKITGNLCPKCGQKSLFSLEGKGTCLNPRCKSSIYNLFHKVSLPSKKSSKKSKAETNISWNKVKEFLRKDKTDERVYVPGLFVCEDYARELQKNAKLFGYDCAIVYIGLDGREEGHMCNAFDTSDKGIVYIDSVGDVYGSTNNDKVVRVEMGIQYHPKFLFCQRKAEPMGIMNHIDVIW